jgi:hypothetical protein
MGLIDLISVFVVVLLQIMKTVDRKMVTNRPEQFIENQEVIERRQMR